MEDLLAFDLTSSKHRGTRDVMYRVGHESPIQGQEQQLLQIDLYLGKGVRHRHSSAAIFGVGLQDMTGIYPLGYGAGGGLLRFGQSATWKIPSFSGFVGRSEHRQQIVSLGTRTVTCLLLGHVCSPHHRSAVVFCRAGPSAVSPSL